VGQQVLVRFNFEVGGLKKQNGSLREMNDHVKKRSRGDFDAECDVLCKIARGEVANVVFRRDCHAGFVIMGLYPPAKSDESKQHDNATSTAIASVVGGFHWNWNDLLTLSSTTTNAVIDQDALHAVVVSRHPQMLPFLTSWWERALDEISAGKRVFVWAGNTVNEALKWLVDVGLVSQPRLGFKTSFARFTTVVVREVDVVFMEDTAHPSYHLLTGRHPVARAAFEATYQTAHLLVQSGLPVSAHALLTALGEEALRSATVLDRRSRPALCAP
jgi:hypothetical protein